MPSVPLGWLGTKADEERMEGTDPVVLQGDPHRNQQREIWGGKLRKKNLFYSFYINNSKWPPNWWDNSLHSVPDLKSSCYKKSAAQYEAFSTQHLILNFWIRWLIDDLVGGSQSWNPAITCSQMRLYHRLL